MKSKAKLPMLILNFKAYSEASGKNAIKLARFCKAAENQQVSIWVAPSFIDLKAVSKMGVKTLAQHIDPVASGKHTGAITAAAVKESGALGTFINHSEKKLSLAEIKVCVEQAKKNKLLSFCFADSIPKMVQIARFAPDFLAFEVPELIATGHSVSTVEPRATQQAVRAVKKINPRLPVLCGAGVMNGNDARAALQLGTEGVVLSSGFVLAQKPQSVLADLVSGFS